MNKGFTALNLAVYNGHGFFVEPLFIADPHAITVKDNAAMTPSPFDVRHSKQKPPIGAIFSQRGTEHDCTKKKTTNGRNALHICGNIGIAKLLLSRKPALIDALANNGDTMIDCAAYYADKHYLQLLLQNHPVCMYLKNNRGQTPLQLFKNLGCLPLVTTLLKFKPDLIDTGPDGETVFAYCGSS